MDTRSSYKCIIISQALSCPLSLPQDLDLPVYQEKDIIKALFTIKRDLRQRMQVIFILSPEEFGSIEEVLKGAKDLDYRGIVILLRKTAESVPPYSRNLLSLRTSIPSTIELYYLINKGFSEMEDPEEEEKRQNRRSENYLDALKDQEALIRIGKMLSLEKDQDKLLRTILYLSKKITGADAGSIFLVEEDPAGKKYLRFKYSHTFSMDLAYEEFIMPLDTNSIAGYVAVTGLVLNIPDVYFLAQDSPVAFNRKFDLSSGYRTKSMLVLPMRGNLDRIIGVIQLINSKERRNSSSGNEAFEILLKDENDFMEKVVPFEQRYEPLMEAVAGQAAIALENSRMIKQIETQFEEFVKASVTAIESRDPATSGHSFRVASMCIKTARSFLKEDKTCPEGYSLTEVQIKELELAALLHDFGKVYLDPSIFTKGKKLFPRDYNYLILRLNFLYRTLELLEGRENRKLEYLKDLRNKITLLNEPTVQDMDPDREIENILAFQGELSCPDLEGIEIPILTESEIINLQIKKGSLNAEERGIIESHVEYTYSFVSKIPWPPEFKEIPFITLSHHEKLDGTGYPRGLKGKESIPLQARIMAVADIYDALVASDRPYKRAVSQDKVLSILQEEASAGKLDPVVVEAFINCRAWEA